MKWGEYKIADLFDILSSKKIFHADQLNNIYESNVENSFPYVVRMTKNNGIKGFILEDPIYTNESNTLSFAQDTFSVFYQKQRYFTGNKVKVLKPLFQNKTNAIMQYFVACFQKALEKLSWGTGSTVESIAETKFKLPTKNGKIDFEFMETFISAIQKLVIKDMVLYADRKLDATKNVINKN